MNDMSQVIIPKSDQINADDLISGPMTITIRDVEIRGGQEQPVSVYFDGSDKAFRPCKSMSRVLVHAWGPDAKVYVGRSLTLYCDPTVKWGGLEVGGIRISHMSHIESKLTMALTATKGSRKPFIVMPMTSAQPPANQGDDVELRWANQYAAKVAAAADLGMLDAFAASRADKLESIRDDRPELYGRCVAARDARRCELEPTNGAHEAQPAHDPETGEITGPDAPPHWQAAVDKALGGVRAAKNLSYLTSVEDAWLGARAGVSDPSVQKRVDDMIDAARRELRAPV